MIFPFSTLSSVTDIRTALPTLPILASRALPLLPLTFSTSVLAISTEWICHLEPLFTLQGPITGKTLSEIFRRSYTNGAWTFLFNIFASIGSSGYLYYALDPGRKGMRGAGLFSSALDQANPVHPLQALNSTTTSNLPLRRSLYLCTCIFGILHLFPFGAFILPHVLSASLPSSSNNPEDRSTHERDVKQALRRWLDVNRIRIWTDVGAAVCSFLALVV